MARITKADLEQLVEVIKTATGNDGYFIEYAYGKPRLYHQGPFGRVVAMASGRERQQIRTKEVSPRLPARELSGWLEGFIEGLIRTNPPVGVPTDVLAMVNPIVDVPEEEELLEAARAVVFEIANFEDMTDEAAEAMRSLRDAVDLYDDEDD